MYKSGWITASGKSTPVHLLLAYCGLFQSLATEALAALKVVMVAALVLAAGAATTLKADDANGGNGSVAVVGCACLAAGGGLIN